jgi:hypothetical protein
VPLRQRGSRRCNHCSTLDDAGGPLARGQTASTVRFGTHSFHSRYQPEGLQWVEFGPFAKPPVNGRNLHSGRLQSRREVDIADSDDGCRGWAASDFRLNGGNRRYSGREGRQERLGVRLEARIHSSSTSKLSRRAESGPKRIASGRTVARHGRRRMLEVLRNNLRLRNIWNNSDAALVQ